MDWAHVVIPHADKVYAARNPHYHYFYYPGYTDDFLFVNTTRYPLSLVAFRKALSLAMNRRAYSINAHYGYALPADIQGVADISGKQGPWPGWVDPSIPQTLAQYNPTAARQLLKSAGFTWNAGGHLIDPKGKPVKLELLNGFYLPQATIEQQNFQALGIDVTLSNVQFAVFYGRITKGNFDLFDGWNNGGSSPYFLYYTTVSRQSYAPIGKDLSLISGNYYNWGRWKNPAMDALLQQFKVTVDPAKQHALVDKMQQLFVQYLPYIPTCTEIVDSNYNDAHFTGFPTLQDNYAYTMPYGIPGDTILMLTHIHPA